MTKIIHNNSAETNYSFSARKGKVYLVGCGLGDVEQLTLKAYRIIQEAQIVLYDHLITDEILALIPSETRKIYVGKPKSCHSISQERINTLIADYAGQGFSVARLKSGDPYIFGRGAEEALYLGEQGYQVEIVAGISSSVAGPACAGIPPTARGYASSFSVVSAHLKDAKFNTDWIPLLKVPNHTTVVLMGLSLAGAIRNAALKSGVARDFPIAIVANASRPEQQSVVTTLAGLTKAAKLVTGPAVIVFGEVVKLYGKLPQYQLQQVEIK
ncbi:MAG: uroporphyrinogen-III C-methyltransferase [Sulfuricurvum sp.]|uniref:uroporphyrinogen-III C-methyltransferase n=1 Tax=Sulfuricurvum sp. TaxID=2025608 RepID=UPI002604DEAC|nr:uroporphyrinogen-III C-methyltransferase [Sulfuricurvum sp.]MDD5159495.1 uroporphyrinogen-III C-methyltransferase [Sulfuricurvum sp.]